MAQVGVRNIEIFGREIRNNDIRRQRPERDVVRPVPEPVLRPVPMMSPSPQRKRWDKDKIVTDLATEDSGEDDDDVIKSKNVVLSPKPILVPRPVMAQEVIEDVSMKASLLHCSRPVVLFDIFEELMAANINYFKNNPEVLANLSYGHLLMMYQL